MINEKLTFPIYLEGYGRWAFKIGRVGFTNLWVIIFKWQLACVIRYSCSKNIEIASKSCIVVLLWCFLNAGIIVMNVLAYAFRQKHKTHSEHSCFVCTDTMIDNWFQFKWMCIEFCSVHPNWSLLQIKWDQSKTDSMFMIIIREDVWNAISSTHMCKAAYSEFLNISQLKNS